MEINEVEESLKDAVEKVLKKDERTRNNYNWLIFQVWKYLGVDLGVNYDLAIEMPSFESISRVARDIQNKEKRFIPDEATIEKREKLFSETKKFRGRYKEDNPTLMANSWMN